MSILKDEPRTFWMFVHLIIFVLAMIWTAVIHDLVPREVWVAEYKFLTPLIAGIGFTTCSLHGIYLMATKSK